MEQSESDVVPSADYGGRERRQLPRIPIEAWVLLRVFNNGGVEHEGQTVNISADGALVLLGCDLGVGCRLELTMTLGDADHPEMHWQLAFEGTAVRVQPMPSVGGGYAIGIRFHDRDLRAPVSASAKCNG